ncbi:MAG TPA: Rne/Rng family ribonuclease, partial [Candidatus Acidoferrum sp.]|nr:Rne/Rng family ribonuclease [Candidatus Acidoferrum sp.]
MSKELVISASSHERRVAILEEGQLVEIYIEREKEFALVGSIYKGKVTRVLPGMQSAFVDIGLDGDAFLYVSDVFENLEDYDHGHSHGDAPAPAIAAASGGALIEPLPGETLSTRNIHEETISLDEPREEHGHRHEHGPSEEFHGAPGHHEDDGGAEGQPAEAHELDERQPESNASAPQNFAPSYNPTRNYPPRIGNDRPQGHDRGGDRGGDRDRGRGGRRGRFGRRRGGDRDRDRRPQGHGGGRNLPPSKYASPQGDRENRGGYDNRRPSNDRAPSTPTESREDDIVLPGESLAKYRARPVPAPVEPLGDHEPEERQPDFEQTPARPAVGLQPGTGTPRRFSGSLPHWVLADKEADAEAVASESATEEHDSAAAAEIHEAEESLTEPAPNAAPALSDEEAVSLSARLVEAKHEETQARAEADSLAGGTDFDEDEAEALHEAHEIAEREEHGHHEEESEEEQDEQEEREEAEAEAREEQFAADSGHEEHHGETGEESHAEENRAEMTEAERADLAHDEAIEHVAAETMSAAVASDGSATEAVIEDDTVLLPGETRTPRNPNAPREDFARIGTNPRSRFQRPQRGGRDRGGDRGGFRGRGGRPDGRSDRPHRGGDRDRGGDRGGDRGRGRFERRGGHGHGPHRGHHGGHAPSRRPQLISEMLKAGQDVVVQIAKEPLGKKGARITSHVALPGRFLVYMPTIDHIGVSRKIASAENRSRLRRLVGEARGSYPGGFIVRTAAGGATDDEIRTDIEFLGKTWNEIKQKHEERKAPALLHRDLNLVERILRDYVSDDFTGIWIDNEEEYGKVVEFVSRFQPKLVNKVKLYTKEQPIFEEFGIQHELDKALRAKVWLKSGGYIVINHTEALVAIDVNTGKFVGKGSIRLEDTIVKTNLEAVKEIVRQIRLRDLGGIIVVDFIDMEERRNREKVLSALQMALEQDKAPSKALSFNEFGLVCITRKRTKQALERVLCQPCPYCTGSGMVKSIPTLCYEIQAEARKMAVADHEGPNLTL